MTRAMRGTPSGRAIFEAVGSATRIQGTLSKCGSKGTSDFLQTRQLPTLMTREEADMWSAGGGRTTTALALRLKRKRCHGMLAGCVSTAGLCMNEGGGNGRGTV